MWFDAAQLSDGALRLLGILTAVHQRRVFPSSRSRSPS